MLDFTEKRRLRRMVYSKPVAIGLFLLVGFIGYTTLGMYYTAAEAENRRETAAAELAELEERERYLQEEIERLATPRGLEEELREKYDVAKEGEKVIVILDGEAEAAAQTASVDVGFVARLKAWFE